MPHQSDSYLGALDALDEIVGGFEDMAATLDRMWGRDQQAARDLAAERRKAGQQLRAHAARCPRRRTATRPRERRVHRTRARVAARSPDDAEPASPGPHSGFRNAEAAYAADSPRLPTPLAHRERGTR